MAQKINLGRSSFSDRSGQPTTFAPLIIAPNYFKNEWSATIALGILLALGEFVGVLQPVQSLLERAAQPLQHTSLKVVQMIAEPAYYGLSLQKTQRRVQELEQRYAEASAQLSELDRLKSENESLRNMINASDIQLQQRKITAPILSYGNPLIAGGRAIGIVPGQLVLVDQTLVGLVGDVSESQSTVKLLFQESSQPLVATTESGVQGLIIGDGRRVLLTEIPIEAEVKEGQRVLTMGQVGIARDMYVGRVISVKADPQSSVQTATLDQGVSFYEANLLEIR